MTEASNATSKNSFASDVEIKGTITFLQDLSVDGNIEGDIFSPSGLLILGPNSEMRGEIRTKAATIYGRINGNVTVEERCELKANCQLYGDLKAGRLVIEEGATFVGKSEVGPTKITQMKPESARKSEQPNAVAAAN